MSDLDAKGNLSSFFQQISKNKIVDDFDYFRLAYICCSEFGWTQEEFEDCEIPFMFSLLNARTEDIELQKKELKNSKR